MAPAEHTLHGQHIGFREDELANPLPVLTLRIAAPTISLTVTPCASMIASVQPLALLASNSRARWRVAGGLRLRLCVGCWRPPWDCPLQEWVAHRSFNFKRQARTASRYCGARAFEWNTGCMVGNSRRACDPYDGCWCLVRP
jgi:hypothetical protein